MKEIVQPTIPNAVPDDTNLGRGTGSQPGAESEELTPDDTVLLRDFNAGNPEHVAQFEPLKKKVIARLLALTETCAGLSTLSKGVEDDAAKKFRDLTGFIAHRVRNFADCCMKMNEKQLAEFLRHIEIISKIGRADLESLQIDVRFLISDSELKEMLTNSLPDLEKKIVQPDGGTDYAILLETINGYTDRLKDAVK